MGLGALPLWTLGLGSRPWLVLVPDTVWGPAWVTWRAGDIYAGWAPLPPEAEFVSGIGIRSFDIDFPPHYWVFVNGRHFMDDRLDYYILPYERNYTIIDLTMIGAGIGVRGDRVFNEGIDVDRIRRFTHQEVTRYELRDPNRPGTSRIEGGNVLIYKPSVSKSQLARPKTYLDRDEAEEKISMEEIEDKGIGGSGLKDDQERERGCSRIARMSRSTRSGGKSMMIRNWPGLRGSGEGRRRI